MTPAATIAEIDGPTLRQWQQEQKAFGLLDVREEWERESFHIGGLHIPMNEVIAAAPELERAHPLVVYCRKGVRSAIVIQRLQERFGFTNLLNLRGGIADWPKPAEAS